MRKHSFNHIFKNLLKQKDGFTLIEVVVSIAVTLILLGITIPAVGGFMRSSEMTELNQNAKTIYLAAQDYLSQAAASGRLSYINEQAAKLSLAEIKAIHPALSTKELADNKENLAYLRLSKSGQDDPALVEILTPFVSDPNVMEQSVLLEYNRNTGIVRSVFYSKKAASLTYSGAAHTRENVLVRTEDGLREKRQGYYGVDYTGNMRNSAALASTNPVLVNAERLTLEWDDITPAGGDWQKFLTYTVVVYSADYSTEYLRIEGVPNPVGAALPGAAFRYPITMKDSENTRIALDTSWNGVAQTDKENREHSISVRNSTTMGKPQKLVLILDDIHRSIYEKYPSIPIGDLRATVEPAVDWIKVPPGQTKEVEHSYFAAGAKDKGKDTFTYELQYARQLNNIRHAPPTSNYTISLEKPTGGDPVIDWEKPEGTVDANSAVVGFEVVNFQYRAVQPDGTVTEIEDIDGYNGTFTSTNNARIDGLQIVPVQSEHVKQYVTYNYTQHYGMFAKLGAGAHIKNLKLRNVMLDTSKYSGNQTYSYVGALAGYAKNATITNFRVETSTIIAHTGTGIPIEANAYTGGIVGYAEGGTFDNVFASGKVLAGVYKTSDKQIMQGRNCVGGLLGYAKKTILKNSESAPSVLGGNNVGGVVGQSDKATLTQIKSTNKKCVVGLRNVGGIVGHNQGTITNASFTYPALQGDGKLSETLSQLGQEGPDKFKETLRIFDEATYIGVLGTENVGGVIGLNDADGGKLSGFNTQQMVKGQKYVGGIVGNNMGEVTMSSAGKTAAGLVVCTEAYAGGIFGINNNPKVALDGFVNEAHVVAEEYAGGIIGSNGDDGEGQSGVKGTTISNCINKGAVFAYQQYGGGIAGRNLGVIDKCESVAGNAEALDKLLTSANIPYGNYVGGITGYNNGKITNCKGGNLVKGHHFVGGITGHNDTAGYIYSCETTGGRIIASGNFAGGYIGLNTSSQLADDKAMGGLDNRATLVKGKQFVGGVIGCNLFTQGNLTIQATNGYANKSSSDASQTVIEGEAYVGGIIGYNTMDITVLPNPNDPDRPGIYTGDNTLPTSTTTLFKCSNYGQVKTLRYGGGIIGLNSAASALQIKQSTNAGIISYADYDSGTADPEKSYYIAGITGRNTRTGVIEDCTNSGKILSRSKYTGGLVEVNEGLMLLCTNAGQVQAEQSNYVGGIAGYNITAGPVAGGINQQATLQQCNSVDTSVVSGVNYVGGIVGANAAIVESCVFSGATEYDANEVFQVSGNDCVGGITGLNQASGTFYNCKTQGGSVRGNNFVGGFTGYNNAPQGLSGTEQQYTINNARVYGQYFVGGITGAHNSTLLEYCANGEYGRVIAAGTGTSGTTELVLEERNIAGEDVVTRKTFALADTGAGGIVGGLRTGETLRACYNAGVVVGAGDRTGGITGQNKGTIENCENRGMVVGSSQASSLASTGTLQAVLKNKNDVGGIVGRNEGGTLTNCSAMPSTSAAGNKQSHVMGGENVGGIVGNHLSGAVIEPSVKDKKYFVTGAGRVGGLFGSWQADKASLTLTDKTIIATVTGTKINSGGPYPVGGIFGRLYGVAKLENYVFDGEIYQETSWERQHIGGIIGRLEDNQFLLNCTMQGKIFAQTSNGTIDSGVGGIVGYNNGRVEGCKLAAKASISGYSMLGGIIGFNDTSGRMIKCLNDKQATVSGTLTTVGGYIGQNTNESALVRTAATDEGGRLINYATVTGGTNVGGIVGLHVGNIQACDNEGEVRILSHFGGGVVGSYRNTGAGKGEATMRDCRNKGKVIVYSTNTSTYGTGGVVGCMDTTNDRTIVVENCHNQGTVEALQQIPGTSTSTYVRALGGIVGRMHANTTVQNCTNAANGTVQFSAMKGRDIGGIAGMVQAGTVTQCENLGTVVLDMPQHTIQTQLPGGTNLGGIAGYVENGGTIAQCNNQAVLQVSDTYRYYGIGGIVGMATSPGTTNTSRVENCNNTAPITVVNGCFVGGILGGSAGATVQGCSNSADISARQQMGGIVGALYRAASGQAQDNAIDTCENSGKILQNPEKITTDSNDSFIGIGGILGDIGAVEASVAITSCENTGDILLEEGQLNGVGGILGRVSFGDKNEIGVTITQSNNSGTITSLGGGVKTSIGGILGNAFLSPVQIENCKNQGDLRDGAGAYQEVGGIAGTLDHKNTKVLGCINEASIEAATAQTRGQEIGGIVGRNGGIVSNCRNLVPLTGVSPVVRGRDQVGGIVGNNKGQAAYIYSDATQQGGGVAITTLNEMKIEATAGVAGGIVGVNSSGGVVDTFNKGEVVASNAAGGIIGKAGALTQGNQRQTAGSLLNSYSIGEVSGGYQVTGGIIGKREDAYDSVRSHNIKQAYYLYNAGKPELSVGNEDGTDGNTVGDADYPKEPAMLADRRLSKELFEANGMPEPDYQQTSAIIAAIQALREKITYPLNQPRNVGTVSNKGYEYTTSWEMVQGPVKNYKVYLRPLGGAAKEGKDIAIGESSKQVDEKGRLETHANFDVLALYQDTAIAAALKKDYGINTFEDMIGMQFDIVVQTIVENDNTAAGPQNSTIFTSEQARKILPVLPAPNPTTYQAFAGKIYELTIADTIYSNNGQSKLDKSLYKNLGTNTLYDAEYRAGVAAFWYENQSADVGGYTGWLDTGISALANVPYQFKIDHSKDMKSTQQVWRDLQLQARSNDTVNGYAHSEYHPLRYKVQVRLNAPTGLRDTATGDAHKATYRFSWNAVANNKGYLATVSYTDAAGVVQTQDIQTTLTSCVWEVPLVQKGTTASFTVITLGDNGLNQPAEENTYLTSAPSEPDPIDLPYQLTAPTITASQEAENDKKLMIQWNTPDAINYIANYTLSIERYALQDPEQTRKPYVFANGASKVTVGAAVQTYDINMADADFGYQYIIQVTANGKAQSSLTSPVGEYSFPVYARRTKPSKLSNVSDEGRTDRQTMTFQWDGKTSAEIDYPALEKEGRFALRFAEENGLTTVATLEVETFDALLQGVDYRFTEENGFVMGKKYIVQLRALAVAGSYAGSMYSEAFVQLLPSRQMSVTGATTVGSQNASVPVTTYHQEQHTVTWATYPAEQRVTLVQQGSFDVRGYATVNGVETDITDELVFVPARADRTPETTAVTVTSTPKHAGKAITFQVIAVAGNVTLHSAAVSAAPIVTLPKAQLVAPAVDTAVENTKNGTVDITVKSTEPVDIAVLQSLVDWEDNIFSYQVVLTLTYAQLEADATTTTKTLVLPMTLDPFTEGNAGTGKRMAKTSFAFTLQALLEKANEGKPDAEKLVALPSLQASWSAKIMLLAQSTEDTGFLSSDGTVSVEKRVQAPEPRMGADFSMHAPEQPPVASKEESTPEESSSAALQNSGSNEAPSDSSDTEPHSHAAEDESQADRTATASDRSAAQGIDPNTSIKNTAA